MTEVTEKKEKARKAKEKVTHEKLLGIVEALYGQFKDEQIP